MRDYLVKEIKATFLDSTFKHTKYSNFPEKFALQLMLNYVHTEALYTLNRRNTISWKGLIDRVRIDIKYDLEYIELKINIFTQKCYEDEEKVGGR